MPEPRAARTQAPGALLPSPRRSADAAALTLLHDVEPGLVEPALQAWADHDAGCLVVVERDHSELVVRWVSRAGAGLLGYDAHELVGRPCSLLTGAATVVVPRPVLDARPPVADDGRGVLRGTMSVRRSDGSSVCVRLTSVPVAHPLRAVWVLALQQVQGDGLQSLAAGVPSLDALTGLVDRRRLVHLLAHDLRASRSSLTCDRPALLLLDVDDFRQVNETLGHDAGDRLLVEVATRLRAAVREGDVVSRLGGDEFAVLCRGVADEGAAVVVARRLLASVAGPLLLSDGLVPVTCSLGLVVAGPAHEEASDLLRDADVAMYQAKGAGKDRFALFDEQAQACAQDRSDLALDLRLAIRAGDLAVHYQPVVELPADDGRPPVLSAVEALARWLHPTRGQVSPAVFVTLAEETGQVAELGMVVLRAACTQMVRWRETLGEDAPPVVAVNVSALQLRLPEFPDLVAEVLADTGLPGSALCLELTETAVMHDTASAAVTFWRLHELGVRIAIDDFGTGYSSLAKLQQLPFDELKIDRSLLTDPEASTRTPVIAAVVALGRALDLDVVAEGVETQEQVVELRELGCPLVQGFFYGRPLPPAQLEGWVLAQRSSESS